MLRGTALAALAAAVAGSGPFPLVLLKDRPTARCMDGTPAGYYLEPAAPGPNASKWIIYIQGGGECGDKPSCDGRAKSALGSSNYFAASISSMPYFSVNNPETNPNFASWSHVYVPYCTSDLFSGTQTERNSIGYYFAGRLVVDAVLDALIAGAGLGAATEVILFGDSAGGIGTFINLDHVAGRLPGARVVGAPIAGFFAPAYMYTGPGEEGRGAAPISRACVPTRCRWRCRRGPVPLLQLHRRGAAGPLGLLECDRRRGLRRCARRRPLGYVRRSVRPLRSAAAATPRPAPPCQAASSRTSLSPTSTRRSL